MSAQRDSERLIVLVDRHLRDCGVNLFADYGFAVTSTHREDASIAPQTLAGIVGFVGDVSGTLLVAAAPALVSACIPARSQRGVSEASQRDWIGELTSQLSERLERRLAAHGLTIDFSPPIVLLGEQLRHIGCTGQTRVGTFTSHAGEIHVEIDVKLARTFVAADVFFEDEVALPAVEKSAQLF